MTFPELETDRLRLRMFRDSDTDVYAVWAADPEIMQYLGEGKPQTRAEAWRSMATGIGHWYLRGCGMWAVEDKSSGELVGRVGCWNPEGWPSIEVGWTIGREHWGLGYASEAAVAARDWAFEELKLEFLISIIRTGNERSVKVAERIGESWQYTLEVLGKECQIYSIERDHWVALRSTD